MSVEILHGDCREKIRTLADNSIDSCVTDPPYALVSIVKRFGSPTAAPARGNEAYQRASAGFMGKAWDTGEVAMSADFWADVFRVLKPGAFLCAFGASRGYHRMACAIEDAGFEIRDSLLDLVDPADPIWTFLNSLNDAQRDAFARCVDHALPGGPLAWLYGTGFPKSHNVALSIDKESGAIGHLAKSFNMKGGGDRSDESADNGRDFSVKHEPKTDAAREWEGWGTALKPAFEPIVLARKPLSESTVAANVLKWRTGALNIGACRVAANDKTPAPVGQYGGSSIGPNGHSGIRDGSADKLGRWPANVVHDGSDEVIEAFPNSKGQLAKVGPEHGPKKSVNVYGDYGPRQDFEPRGDSGSAARFFYSAKASKADRAGSKHPTVKPVALMQWLCRMVTPPGGTVLDPFAGSGTTGAAAMIEGFSAVLIERENEYVADIKRRLGVVESTPDLEAMLA